MELSDFRLLSKHDADKTEKCPRCLQIFQNFLDLGHNQLACLKCGCVFVGRDVRSFVDRNQKAILKSQELEVQIKEHFADELVCACGFKAKNKTGLVAHKRHCNNGRVNGDLSDRPDIGTGGGDNREAASSALS